MKTLKKTGALLVALVMAIVLGLTAIPASADDSYAITISNAQAGTTYAAYKIFDAGSGTDANGETVSYYTLNANAGNGAEIYDYMTGTTTASDLFQLTESGTKGIYYVQTATDATTDGIVDYLKTMVPALTLTATVTVTNTSDATIILDVTEAGYYFVSTSADDAVVMLTTANPTATIIDKQVVPGNVQKTISKAEIEGSIGTDEHEATEAIGDYVDFEITAEVPLYSNAEIGAQEGRLVTSYVFTDTMDNGLEIRGLEKGKDYTVKGGSYYATKDLLDRWIKITDKTTGDSYALTDVAYDISMELTGDTVTYIDNEGNRVEDGFVVTGFTLIYYTFDMETYNSDTSAELATAADIITEYPANASITIGYEVYVSEEAAYENDNTITMDWYMTTFAEPFGPTGTDDEDNPNDPDHPNRPYFPKRDHHNVPGDEDNDYETPEEPDDEDYPDPFNGTSTDKDEVYVLRLDIDKIDGQTKDPLAGAKFELVSTNLKEIVVTTTEITDEGGNTTYEYEYGEKETNGCSVEGVTGDDGQLEFSGLTMGKWTLKEIEAPTGYNLVSSEYTIEIEVDWQDNNTDGIYEPVWTVTVTNANGTPIDDAFDSTEGIISLTVENYQGSLLPGTGGAGTTVFYVVGICLIVGAGVLLVTRKRVNRG